MNENRMLQRQWTSIPPLLSGRQVEGTSFLPFGRYVMPDGSEQVSFGLPQPMLDAVRAIGFAGGQEQDPQAPQGYVSQNAMLRGGAGLAGSAMVSSMGARAPANALTAGRPRQFRMDYYGTPVKVFQNPSEQALARFLQNTKYKAARRVIDEDTGDVYVWDAGDPALHEMMAQQLGISRHVGDMIGLDD